MTKPGWGAVVQGEPTDLEGWVDNLKEPFDPWVEIHGGETVLRSASFDELTSDNQVRDRAVAYIERLNGALALSQQTRPVRFGGVIQFAPGGQIHRFMYLEGVALQVGLGKIRVDITQIGPDGKPVPPPPPQPSEVQRWAEVAEGDDLLDDALMYFGKALDWFDIYKALECLFLKAGGEREFLALAWASESEIVRLKRTANWARHAKRKFVPPLNPMPLKDARALLGQLLQCALRP